MKNKFCIITVAIMLVIATMITVSAANAINERSNVSPPQNETTEANNFDLTPDKPAEATDEQTNEAELAEKPEDIEPTDIITKERIDTDLWIAQNKIVHEVAPVFVQGNMKVYSAKKALEELPFSFDSQPKYRDIYYREPWFLYDLVSPDEWNEWCTDIIIPNIQNNTQPNEPYVLTFVKHFQIEKEDFIKCVEKLRERQVRLHGLKSNEYPNEMYELHNADVIYTFDTELINNYYLRDQSGIKYSD